MDAFIFQMFFCDRQNMMWLAPKYCYGDEVIFQSLLFIFLRTFITVRTSAHAVLKYQPYIHQPNAVLVISRDGNNQTKGTGIAVPIIFTSSVLPFFGSRADETASTEIGKGGWILLKMFSFIYYIIPRFRNFISCSWKTDFALRAIFSRHGLT